MEYVTIYVSDTVNTGNLKTEEQGYKVKSNSNHLVCPSTLVPLIQANEKYLTLLQNLQPLRSVKDYGVSLSLLGRRAALDSEVPKLKELSDGLNDAAFKGIGNAMDKTGIMLLDGCALSENAVCKETGEGEEECIYTAAKSTQDLIKNADKYLK